MQVGTAESAISSIREDAPRRPPKYDNTSPVTWFIPVHKIQDWPKEKFIYEYQVVHANMSRMVQKMVPVFEDYAQVIVEEDDKWNKPSKGDGWDAATVHIWSSLDAIYSGFSDPGYKASAGKHVFANLDHMGCLAKPVGEIVASTTRVSSTDTSLKTRSYVFHRRGPGSRSGGTETETWLRQRLEAFNADGKVLRYRAYCDHTPEDIETFFKDTLFQYGTWREWCAVEEFDFQSGKDATQYLEQHEEWIADGQKVTIITGTAYKVFGTD